MKKYPTTSNTVLLVDFPGSTHKSAINGGITIITLFGAPIRGSSISITDVINFLEINDMKVLAKNLDQYFSLFFG